METKEVKAPVTATRIIAEEQGLLQSWVSLAAGVATKGVGTVFGVAHDFRGEVNQRVGSIIDFVESEGLRMWLSTDADTWNGPYVLPGGLSVGYIIPQFAVTDDAALRRRPPPDAAARGRTVLAAAPAGGRSPPRCPPPAPRWSVSAARSPAQAGPERRAC